MVALGFIDKAKSGELTQEDWNKISKNYQETHGSDFYEDMNAEKANAEKAAQDAEKAAQHDAALALLNTATAENC